MDYYDKTNWENGDTITADLLNNVESGLCGVKSGNNDTLTKLMGFFNSIFGGSLFANNADIYTPPRTGGIDPETGEDDDTQTNAQRCDLFWIESGGYYSLDRNFAPSRKNIRVYIYNSSNTFLTSFNWEYGLLFHVNTGEKIRVVEVDPGEAYVGQAFKVRRHDYIYNPSKFELPSSTQGSAKKFQISVDDSGTITATEV